MPSNNEEFLEQNFIIENSLIEEEAFKKGDELKILKERNSKTSTFDCLLNEYIKTTPQETSFSVTSLPIESATVPNVYNERVRSTENNEEISTIATIPKYYDDLEENQAESSDTTVKRTRRTRRTTEYRTTTERTRRTRPEKTSKKTTQKLSDITEDIYDEITTKKSRTKRTRPTTDPLNLITRTPRTRRTTVKRVRATKTLKPMETISVTTQSNLNEFNWVSQGLVTAVKDQKKCSSSWAYAVCAAMESQLLIKSNISIDLSEQQILDCNNKEWACLGGDAYATMNWLKFNPVTTEQFYPYRAEKSFCKKSVLWQSYKIVDQTKNYELNGNENELKNLVKNHGPAVVGVYASDYFQSYKSGIFVDNNCNLEPNHAVLVVGEIIV